MRRAAALLLAGALALAGCSTTEESDRPREQPRSGGAAPVRSSGVIGGSRTEGAVEQALSRLPLTFTRNVGQVDPQVAYYSQGLPASFWFTADGLTMALAADPARSEADGWALELDLVGARRVRPVATNRAPGVVNYLVGPTEEWRTSIPTYRGVLYRDLWEGIDLRFEGTPRTLKYSFVVRPGADPADIRLRYRGAGGVSLDPEGNLLIPTPVGTLEDSRPRSYEMMGGARAFVDSRYVLAQDGSYGFELPDRHPGRTHVIDPGLSYSTYLGGAGIDIGVDVAVDRSGAAYVTGTTESSNFPTTSGAFDRGLSGIQDAFVTKVNPNGSALSYSTFLGGDSFDDARGIAVDEAGNAYVTGLTFSSDFPTTPGASDRGLNGLEDAFVSRLNPNGSALSFSTFLGGSSDEIGWGIAVDGAGNAYVTGQTDSSNFPTTPGASDRSLGGDDDAFVTKLVPNGSALSYSTFLGGSDVQSAFGIAVDAAGSAYVTGHTYSPSFPITPTAPDRTFDGFSEAFVTKLVPTGSALSYSTFLGGSGSDAGNAIAVNGAGSAHVTGDTFADFPTTPGAFDRTFGGFSDAFVTKLNPTGSALSYSTLLGGDISDVGQGIAVDQAGNAYVSGHTSSPNFPTTPGSFDRRRSGFSDAFVTKVNPTGSALSYSTFLGGDRFDTGGGVAVDDAGNAYVTGFTLSSNFPTSPGAFDRSLTGPWDAFVTKLTTKARPGPACTITGTPGKDRLVGTSGRDVICGLGGDDHIKGLPGNDLIVAGPGADVAIGGVGNDRVRGGPGADFLRGDFPNHRPGADVLRGNHGPDRLVARDGVSGNDTADGGAGTDACSADAGDVVIGCP